MKNLTVLVLCVLVCLVDSYRIFPLPGQSVPDNPKFGHLSQSSFRASNPTSKPFEVYSRSASFDQRPFFSAQQSQTVQFPDVSPRLGNFEQRSLFSAQSTQPQTIKTPPVNFRSENIEQKPLFARFSHPTTQTQTSRISEVTSFQNFARPLSTSQPVVASTETPKAVEISRVSQPSQAPTPRLLTPLSFVRNPPILVPSRTNAAVAQLANDLLPPTENPKPDVTTTTLAPTRAAPFNDLLPPKES